MAKVSINLTDLDLAKIEILRNDLGLETKTGTVASAIAIAEFFVAQAKQGKQIALLDKSTGWVTPITIPSKK